MVLLFFGTVNAHASFRGVESAPPERPWGDPDTKGATNQGYQTGKREGGALLGQVRTKAVGRGETAAFARGGRIGGAKRSCRTSRLRVMAPSTAVDFNGPAKAFLMPHILHTGRGKGVSWWCSMMPVAVAVTKKTVRPMRVCLMQGCMVYRDVRNDLFPPGASPGACFSGERFRIFFQTAPRGGKSLPRIVHFVKKRRKKG